MFYFALQPFGKVERKRDLEDTKGRGFFFLLALKMLGVLNFPLFWNLIRYVILSLQSCYCHHDGAQPFW